MTYTIYGHNQCPFCVKARQFLQSRDIPFSYIDIRKNEDAMKFVKEGLQARTVPQIMLGSNGIISHIGGYEELVKSFESQDADSLFDD